MDPMAAATDTHKQTMLSICSTTALLLDLGIFLIDRYISTGKYTVNGQKASAPSNPNMSLKKGKTIAKSMLIVTNEVLHISLKVLILTEEVLLKRISVISFVTIKLFGCSFFAMPSTMANTGWQKTCSSSAKLIC
ncbi:hypothetical protein AXF42_Ash011270 [Apostasia shenzhenica]|uniref:Uncharacterized protein n=1 Tax=Apostasia shenzhenica TaxID=1088818 RepID=A0A2I0AE15_9ASPA|nr:hypothetical protein AXF42_Ash011270 [Apostasia shenzhenica]